VDPSLPRAFVKLLFHKMLCDAGASVTNVLLLLLLVLMLLLLQPKPLLLQRLL
jgi:hypothetical protein